MLVIHWTRHNKIASVLRNGLTPHNRRLMGGLTLRGIWVSPLGPHRTWNGYWMHNLSRHALYNFNGVVFRLRQSDFPILAGDWVYTHFGCQEAFESLESFERTFQAFHSPDDPSVPPFDPDRFGGYEIVLRRRVTPNRFMKILKDREPVRHRHSDPDWRRDAE